ncbi:MAG: hypothetical protein ACFB13_03440 [Kiloniellaceae bacterium]
MVTHEKVIRFPGFLVAVMVFLFGFPAGLPTALAQDDAAVLQKLAKSCTSPRACLVEAFVFDGAAIHPLAVRALAGLPSDGRAVITAVDLEAAQDANQFCCSDSFEISLDEAGHIGATIDLVDTFSAAQVPKEDCPEGCWFAYRFQGSTDGGVAVVQTWERSGGTATFSSLLFLKYRRAAMFDGTGWHQQVQLTSLGKLNLGEAAEAPIVVKGGSVFVGEREIPVAN